MILVFDWPELGAHKEYHDLPLSEMRRILRNQREFLKAARGKYKRTVEPCWSLKWET